MQSVSARSSEPHVYIVNDPARSVTLMLRTVTSHDDVIDDITNDDVGRK